MFNIHPCFVKEDGPGSLVLNLVQILTQGHFMNAIPISIGDSISSSSISSCETMTRTSLSQLCFCWIKVSQGGAKRIAVAHIKKKQVNSNRTSSAIVLEFFAELHLYSYTGSNVGDEFEEQQIQKTMGGNEWRKRERERE